jgi:large subunit ribosomal protein L30
MKIKLVKSPIGNNARIRATIKTLGFKKLNQTIEVKDDPCVIGKVNKVKHMLEILDK